MDGSSGGTRRLSSQVPPGLRYTVSMAILTVGGISIVTDAATQMTIIPLTNSCLLACRRPSRGAAGGSHA